MTLLSVTPTVQSENQDTEEENIIVSTSSNSKVFNENDVRDGYVGVNNQAELWAKSCEFDTPSSSCTNHSWAEIYLEVSFASSVSSVNISIEYESWGKDNSFGEESISAQYEMVMNIQHKHGEDIISIESGQTTGSGNNQVVNIGTFEPSQTNNLSIKFNISHTDTNWIQDKMTARLHEIFIMVGSDSTGDIAEEPPSISYENSSFTYTKGSEITPSIQPLNLGSYVDLWEIISGSLPMGLNFDNSTGIISGTPNEVFSSASLTIRATNAAGSDTTTISIQVNDAYPVITYDAEPYVFTRGAQIDPTIQPISSGGKVEIWEIIDGYLPPGLSIDISTGEISGIPTQESFMSSFTVRATNSGGSDTASLLIQVNEVAPVISYAELTYNLTIGLELNPGIHPLNNGGAVNLWEIIHGSLPNGLSFDNSTGVISGNPIEATFSSILTIRGTNSGGFDTSTVTIEVAESFSEFENQSDESSSQDLNETNKHTNQLDVGDNDTELSTEPNSDLAIVAIAAIAFVTIAYIAYNSKGSRIEITTSPPQTKPEVIVIQQNTTPVNHADRFALWCIEKIGCEGGRKIGDNSQLNIPANYLDWIDSLNSKYAFSVKISFGINYPSNLNSTNKKDLAISLVDRFLQELSAVGGNLNDGKGFFSHSTKGNLRDIQVEFSGAFSVSISPIDLVTHLGLVRTAVWDFCSHLLQKCVHIQIGNMADFINPLPEEERKKIFKQLDEQGIEQIDLDRAYFMDSIERQREEVEFDLDY